MSALHFHHLVVLQTFVLTLANTETIHFTNSPQHQVHQINDNFTSYKLIVPGSDPITIIESTNNHHHHHHQHQQQQQHDQQQQQNEALPSALLTNEQQQQPQSDSERENMDRDKAAVVAAVAKVIQRRNGERYSEKELVSRSSSMLQRLNNRNQDVSTSLGIQIDGGTEPSSSAAAEKTKVIDEDMIDGDTADGPNGGPKKIIYSPMLLQKFIQDYTDKIKHADQSTKNALKEIERLNNPDETTDRIDFNDDQLEQKYNWDDRNYNNRNQQRPQQNPFNDKNGWVTLEAVPWSTSKVSKWHPNNEKYNNYEDDGKGSLPYPPSWNEDSHNINNNNNNNNNYPQKPRPPSYYDDVNEDDYLDNRPTSPKPAIYTSYDPYRPSNDRPSYTKPQNFHYEPQSGYDRPQKPTFNPRPRPPQYDYGHHSSSSNTNHNYFVTHSDNKDKWYDHRDSESKPWSEDIVTDNRPSTFPKQPYQKRPPPPQPHQRPANTLAQDRYEYHPFSHPDSGNGEWVLVSSTKGYQSPPPVRHGQRAISLKQPTKNDITSSHHSVKLTVLPTLNNTFSHDGRRPMALSHGGLLEVESSFDTVDDSVASAFSSAPRNQTASKVTTRKRRIYKGVPMKSRITGGQDASAVLAAVGAGMVPATVAMLMPMMLGRKKRSLNETGYYNIYDLPHLRENAH